MYIKNKKHKAQLSKEAVILAMAILAIFGLLSFLKFKKKGIEPAKKADSGVERSKCWDEYNQRLKRCRSLKIIDPSYAQCPTEAMTQYNSCITK